LTRHAVIGMTGLCLMLASLFLFWVKEQQRWSRRGMRRAAMRQIGLALHNFSDIYGRLPPAVRRDEFGRPLCSWRFQILPLLEAVMMGIETADRWDDPANRWWITGPHPVYCFFPEKPFPQRVRTNVVAVTGPGTAFDEEFTFSLGDLDDDTILVIDVADSDVHWMEPGDLDVRDLEQSVVQGVDGDGIHVLFADGEVWFLSSQTPLKDLKPFFTVDGARQFDRQDVLAPYALPRSF